MICLSCQCDLLTPSTWSVYPVNVTCLPHLHDRLIQSTWSAYPTNMTSNCNNLTCSSYWESYERQYFKWVRHFRIVERLQNISYVNKNVTHVIDVEAVWSHDVFVSFWYGRSFQTAIKNDSWKDISLPF